MQKIIPAILTQDPADLKEKLEIFKGNTSWLHIDIMDGTLVPDRTVNLLELGEASKFFNLEIHLMVEDPLKYFEDCEEAGVKRVVFHAEAVENIPTFLEKAKNFEFQKSVAIGLNLAKLSLEKLSLAKFGLSGVLLMAINKPGAQGRPFDPAVLQKIQQAKELYPNLLRGVDGGIGKENIQSVFTSGADYVAVGSEIMRAENPVATFRILEAMIS